MEKISKKLSYICIGSAVSLLISVIFGILSYSELKKMYPDEQSTIALLVVVLVTGISLMIVTVISFISMRKGNVKSAILAVGKYSKVQTLGPFACFIGSIVGIAISANNAGEKLNTGGLVFIIVTFLILSFTFSLNSRGLKAYRKDKESFLYISTTAFITALAVAVFLVGAVVCMLKIPAQEGSNFVGYVIVTAIFLTLTDLIAYVSLGLLAFFANKYAPKTTMADANAEDLTRIGEKIDQIAENQKVETPKSAEEDKYDKLAKLKKLYDDGVLTKEEFDEEKKKLL